MKKLLILTLLVAVLSANEHKLPKCDSSNPKVFFIKSVDDWKHINDKDKEIFCVYPGDYSNVKDSGGNNESKDKQIEITQSGTKKHPRYILLYNDNNLHPAKLPKDKLAKYLLRFKDTSYWVVDREAFWEVEGEGRYGINILYNSSNITFNRLYFKDTDSVFFIYNGSNNNTIQNSYFVKTKWAIDHKRLNDSAAINLFCLNPNEAIKNTKIINNEIVNYVDGVQTVRLSKAYNKGAKIDFEGTKILNNLIYVTDEFYSDCKGKSKIDGECSFSENAIDLKGGSLKYKNPILIKDNIMFGYKKADGSYSDLNDAGSVVALHYSVPNVTLENNLIFNSNYGFDSDGPMPKSVALKNITLKNNIFYNLKVHAINLNGSYKKGLFDGAKNVKIEKNIFTKVKGGTIKLYNTNGVSIVKNIFTNTSGFWIPDPKDDPKYYKLTNKNLHIKFNKFYNFEKSFPSYAKMKGNSFLDSEFNLNKIDRQFKIKKFTNEPKDMELFE